MRTQTAARQIRASIRRAAPTNPNAAAAAQTDAADPTIRHEAAAAARRHLSHADQIWEADLYRAPESDGWRDIC